MALYSGFRMYAKFGAAFKYRNILCMIEKVKTFSGASCFRQVREGSPTISAFIAARGQNVAPSRYFAVAMNKKHRRGSFRTVVTSANWK